MKMKFSMKGREAGILNPRTPSDSVTGICIVSEIITTVTIVINVLLLLVWPLGDHIG